MERLFNACFVRSWVVFSCLRVWFIDSSSTLFLCSLVSVLWLDQLCLSFTLAQSFSDFSFIIFLSYSPSLPPHTCNLFLIIICSLFHNQAPQYTYYSFSVTLCWFSVSGFFFVFCSTLAPCIPYDFLFCSLVLLNLQIHLTPRPSVLGSTFNIQHNIKVVHFFRLLLVWQKWPWSEVRWWERSPRLKKAFITTHVSWPEVRLEASECLMSLINKQEIKLYIHNEVCTDCSCLADHL